MACSSDLEGAIQLMEGQVFQIPVQAERWRKLHVVGNGTSL